MYIVLAVLDWGYLHVLLDSVSDYSCNGMLRLGCLVSVGLGALCILHSVSALLQLIVMT